ncbi:conserved hypothetical protein [Gammaproteobacteria bacterium]
MYRERYKKYISVALGFIVMEMSGCTTIGPNVLRSDRPEYNRSIQQTEKEELLLNIVRTRYGENIKFLQIASIVSTLSIGGAFSGNLTVPFGKQSRVDLSGANIANIGGGINYGETPTITYVPIEGQQFATQFLSGIPINTLQVLLQSGWYIDNVMELVIDRMGGLINDSTTPSFSKFMELMKIFRKIQARGDLQFTWLPQTDTILADKLPSSAVNTRIFNATSASNLLRYYPLSDGKYKLIQLSLAVVMELHYANQEEANQVSGLLGGISTRPKDKLVEKIELTSAIIPPSDFSNIEPVTQIPINLRSFLDMLYSVMSGVAVPTNDASAAFPDDASSIKLMNIQSSESYPTNAFVAIPYRGRWFFIADSDLNSKANLSLLLNILSLQTTSAGAAPGLSLSVGK